MPYLVRRNLVKKSGAGISARTSLRSRMPDSLMVRLPFLSLHALQQATQLRYELSPPIDFGIMWSTVVAAPPQYAQRCLSRSSTARLENLSANLLFAWTPWREMTMACGTRTWSVGDAMNPS
jgi:hypothetical protein